MSTSLNYCRICLDYRDPATMKPIFSENSSESPHELSITEIVFLVSGVQIEISELLPTTICESCFENVSLIRNFREQCIKSENYFREVINPLIKEESESFVIQSIGVPVSKDHPNKTHSVVKHHISKTKQSHQNPDSTKNKVKRKVVSNEEGNSSNPIVHPCSYCGKVFRTTQLLYSHEKTHLKKPESKNFECDLCGKKFALKIYLYAHVINVHLVDKKYKCEKCDKSYSRIDSFKNHIAQHLEVKPFACSQCPKTFGSKKHLQIHFRVHSGERPYKCSYCSRTYAHYSDNKRHMMTHTGERPYTCNVCGKGFIKKSCLTTHQRVHYSNENSGTTN